MSNVHYEICEGCDRPNWECRCCVDCGEYDCVCDCTSTEWCLCGADGCPANDHCHYCREPLSDCDC